MMTFAAGYLALLIICGLLDLIWLSAMTGRLYRPALATSCCTATAG
jgi:uncharacterized membrane protein